MGILTNLSREFPEAVARHPVRPEDLAVAAEGRSVVLAVGEPWPCDRQRPGLNIVVLTVAEAKDLLRKLKTAVTLADHNLGTGAVA